MWRRHRHAGWPRLDPGRDAVVAVRAGRSVAADAVRNAADLADVVARDRVSVLRRVVGQVAGREARETEGRTAGVVASEPMEARREAIGSGAAVGGRLTRPADAPLVVALAADR